MQQYKGLPASTGIAIGPAWIYRPTQITVDRHTITDPETEWQRLEAAKAHAQAQLQELEVQARTKVGENEAAIFSAHQLFLEDTELLAGLDKAIRIDRLNAEAAVQDTFEYYAQSLSVLDDDYLQARAADVRDVAQRLLRCLQSSDDTPTMTMSAIVFAADLTPSDTIQFDRTKILGLCTVRGGPTSHTAILARALGVPAVVGTPLDLETVADGVPVILNGSTGNVTIEPTYEAMHEAEQQLAALKTVHSVEVMLAHAPATTIDGHSIEVVANIGGIEDTRQALSLGAEGVGLFRTEFLFLDRTSMPSEEEQVRSYCEVFELMEGKPIVVRTLDIGGDKPAPYLDLTPEPNPFLGWRAIRMIWERPDVLASQFRALLIASETTNTDLRIMLPLISRIDEVRRARALFNDVQRELKKQGHQMDGKVQFGIMIEVPAAALLARHFAALVDFFSIGTNDLTQYTLAVDRTNERVAPLASPYNPAVLQLIDTTIQAAHAHGKWVGLCGEMAGDPQATGLLLGLGLDEFSMSPSSVPSVKAEIRRWTMERGQQVAKKTLSLLTATDVLTYLAEVRSNA